MHVHATRASLGDTRMEIGRKYQSDCAYWLLNCVSKIAQQFHSLSKCAEAGSTHGQASRKPSHVGEG